MNEQTDKDEDTFGLGCALEYFSEFKEVMGMIDNLKLLLINSKKSNIERAYERFVDIFKQYHEQPHLLDANLENMLEKLVGVIRNPESSMQLKHETLKYMCVIIYARGYKVIVRQLPHEVADFEPVLQLLECQDPNDSETWTTRYVLLLWMSIIVMIPFHMSRLDGFDESSDSTNKTVMSRVLDVCKTYTVVPGKCRDAAAFLISKFLTRSDVKEKYLSSFFDWACELSISTESNTFVKYGTLASVAMIIKHAKRDDILPHAQRLLQWIINTEFKSHPGSNIQKLVYKIVQRIGLIFLPPRLATWRYKRGNRSLTANLSAGDGAATSNQGDVVSHIFDTEDIEVPEEIEEVIDQLIQGLRSTDSVVRWSAAKGIGRVTGRLPKELADEVVGSVLELFSPREGDGAWHGGCLALAELGRRGLLLPQRLPEVVPVVLKALVYDEPRGYSSVGSHIRDAACYVSWSFARAYETDVLQPYVNEIASQLLVVTCFDREINCRRAASASFQENVGRQGTFPHGIDILTTADFFSVSVRNSAYLTISVYIAQFEEYTQSLIDHLVDTKVSHWDLAIRDLSAKALHNLTPKSPDYMIVNVLPKLFKLTKSIDLNCRHGAILSIGYILHALSKVAQTKNVLIDELVNEEIIDEAKNLVPLFREKLYFRGMGGELMKQACADFIEKCSLSHMPFHKTPIINDWLNLLNECLSYDAPNIRIGAINALPAILTEYYNGSTQEEGEEQSVIIKKYIKELKLENNEIPRMGHALALGALPAFMLKSHVGDIVDALIGATKITQNSLKWAESRRDVIKALTSICNTLENEFGSDLSNEQIGQMYACFLNGLNEYTQDNRGDIGAWVREASMSGLQVITLILANKMPEFLDENLVTQIITGVAQQAVEKIDRTRTIAGKVFYSLIHNEATVPNIPNYDEIVELFPKKECELLNWNSASITFRMFVNLIQFEAYSYKVLLGFVCSVGGMTETLVKSSSHSLFEYLKSELVRKGNDEIIRFCEIIYKIFTDFQKNDRITVPMLRFLDKLFSSGCINVILDDESSDFAKKTLKAIQLEINGCKDIYKLIDGINILCQFIQIKNEVCSTALIQLSILLCHRKPYVRRSASTKLFESLLVYGDNSIIPEENLDEISTILSTTNWENEIDDIKPIRNNICTLMGIRVPVPRQK